MSCSSPIRWLDTSTARPCAASVAQKAAHPDDALGVEAVEGLVEHEHRRVAEHSRRYTEPLAHAQRVAPCPASDRRLQAGLFDDLVDAARRQALRVGQPEQVVTAAAARVQRAGVQQRPHTAQRVAQAAIRSAADQRAALLDRVQAEDHPHRGGLSGAVGADEAGDLPGRDGEGQSVQSHGLAEALAQIPYFDGRLAATDDVVAHLMSFQRMDIVAPVVRHRR